MAVQVFYAARERWDVQDCFPIERNGCSSVTAQIEPANVFVTQFAVEEGTDLVYEVQKASIIWDTSEVGFYCGKWELLYQGCDREQSGTIWLQEVVKQAYEFKIQLKTDKKDTRSESNGNKRK